MNKLLFWRRRRLNGSNLYENRSISIHSLGEKRRIQFGIYAMVSGQHTVMKLISIDQVTQAISHISPGQPIDY